MWVVRLYQIKVETPKCIYNLFLAIRPLFAQTVNPKSAGMFVEWLECYTAYLQQEIGAAVVLMFVRMVYLYKLTTPLFTRTKVCYSLSSQVGFLITTVSFVYHSQTTM